MIMILVVIMVLMMMLKIMGDECDGDDNDGGR